MTGTLNLRKPEFRQETRLGLVVYGGVSLAIYMNGVCQEFFNAVRGRSIYKLIKALTDSDIVVDIISGTSAGGINGILLSYALTNSNEVQASTSQDRVVEFRHFAKIWRDSGSINELLRQPGKKQTRTDSILDGEGYYQQELANALKQATSEVPIEANDWYSPFPELDLFVTGTDVLGKVYRTFDNTGRVIEVKDHRTVFKLGYREGRKNSFDPKNANALAKLCRITSCFPVAFPVVSVDLPSSDSSDNTNDDTNFACGSVDECLTKWGSLADRELPKIESRQLHFVDGGVLDNRPFSYTINQIYYRTASRPVNRKLFYIDPTPDSFLNTDVFKNMARPTIWQSALDSLVNLPRYESIASDLNAIKEHNERVRRYKFLRATAEREAEKQADEEQSKDLQRPLKDDEEHIYLRCRLIGLRDRILPLLLQLNRAFNPTLIADEKNSDAYLENAAQVFTRYVADEADQIKREELLHEIGQEVRNLDIEYALRKHLYFLEKIFHAMEQSNDEEERDYLKSLAAKISRQVELLEVIQSRLNWLLTFPVICQNFEVLLNEQKQPQQYQKLLDAMNSGATANVQNGVNHIDIEKQKHQRKAVFTYLFCLHRFLLNLNEDKFEPSQTVANNPIADLKKGFFKQFKREQLSPQAQASDWIVTTDAEEARQPNLPNLKQFKQLLDRRIQRLQDDSQNPSWAEENLIKILESPAYRQFDGKENYSSSYHSVLRKIELASEALIRGNVTEVTQPESRKLLPLKHKLLKTFRNFRKLDQAVYSYEYLSDLHEKNLIEIIRVSPDAAKLGLGAGMEQDDKLAGDQFRAFGGFFKKSWRSNDILWGRLDGLNRIAETLITPESIQRFAILVKRETEHIKRQTNNTNYTTDDYLKDLINESLPQNALDIEKAQAQQAMLGFLQQLVEGKSLSSADFKALLEAIVMTGHRSILQQDLKNVFEDALLEQVEWNQQAVDVDLRTLVYRKSVPKRTDPQSKAQLDALRQVDCLLDQLVTSRQIPKIPQSLQKLVDNYTKDCVAETPNDEDEIKPIGLKKWLQTAYPKLKEQDSEVNHQQLHYYFLNFAKTINSSKVSLDRLYQLLRQLLETGKNELNNPNLPEGSDIRKAIKSINDQVEAMVETLTRKPAYGPVAGRFDKAVTPFAIRELAKAPIDKLSEEGELETYFRRDYRVAKEDLSRDVPPYILNDITARVGLIIRDVVGSDSVGNQLQRNPLYQFANYGLQAYYQFVQFNNPGVYRDTILTRFVLKFVPLIIPLLIGGVIWYFLNGLPKEVILAIVTFVIVLSLYTIVLQVKPQLWFKPKSQGVAKR